MHEQQHRPPVGQGKPPEPAAGPRKPVRRPVAAGAEAPPEAVQRKEDGAPAFTAPPAEPPPPPPPRLFRACSACHAEDEERRAEASIALSQPGDPLEREADAVADRVMRAADPAPLRLSRACDEDAPIARAEAPGSGGTTTTGGAAAAGLIVEDSETKVDPKQMRKGAFLGALRPAVDAAVDEGYTGTLDRIAARVTVAARFAMYSAQDAKSLEQSLHREVGGAGTAAGYIPIVVARVKKEIADDVAEKKRKEAEDKRKDAEKPGLFFKAKAGGPREADDPRAVQAELGDGGAPLPGGVRSGLESAMGHDFSGVRVHTGADAQKLSGELDARAFTVGRDIAFGAGEYHPGTPAGDALLAHELAHVVQQGGSPAVARKGEGAADGALEADADQSAMGAVLSIWGGVKNGAAALARKAGAGLKTGLKLQRCGAAATGTTPTPQPSANPSATPSADPNAPKKDPDAPKKDEGPQLEGCPPVQVDVSFVDAPLKIDAKGLTDAFHKSTSKLNVAGHTKITKGPDLKNLCPQGTGKDRIVGSVQVILHGVKNIPVRGKVTTATADPVREEQGIKDYFRLIAAHEQVHADIYTEEMTEAAPDLIGKSESAAKVLLNQRFCRALSRQTSLDKAAGCVVVVNDKDAGEDKGAVCNNTPDYAAMFGCGK